MVLQILTENPHEMEVRYTHGLSVLFGRHPHLYLKTEVGPKLRTYKISLEPNGELYVDGVSIEELLWQHRAENHFRPDLESKKMTLAQFDTLVKKVVQYKGFPNEVFLTVVGCPGVVGAKYGELFIGIELDGYAHT